MNESLRQPPRCWVPIPPFVQREDGTYDAPDAPQPWPSYSDWPRCGLPAVAWLPARVGPDGKVWAAYPVCRRHAPGGTCPSWTVGEQVSVRKPGGTYPARIVALAQEHESALVEVEATGERLNVSLTTLRKR